MPDQSAQDRILNNMAALYGKDRAHVFLDQLIKRLEPYRDVERLHFSPTPLHTLGELDSILITYGDQFQIPDQPHLQTLGDFIRDNLKGIISGIHILPFFPYSSDDGFSVIDYKAVNPDLGDWNDIHALRESCNLMFDAVINHISRQSEWFQKYLQDQDPYREYFLSVDPGTDLSQVTRPRAKPLLTEVETKSGIKHVWTTFSPDQIDLNFESLELLLDILDVLLFYVKQGASILRLDAIAYLWKEIGTNCIHLPQTHQVIKLMRSVLDIYAPGVILITETNVPHAENISYFGQQLHGISGVEPLGDEAQMVYQFPLAPLVLHTFRTGNATKLTKWAASLEVPFSSAAFLNFIASHDGIGVRPAEGLLNAKEIQALVDQTLDHGGQVSHKANLDGSDSVYELNITLYDALNHPERTSQEQGVKRFLASQAIMISLAGVPGIYVHSLFGSTNNQAGVAETGRPRSINREKFNFAELENLLADAGSRASRVFQSYSHLLRVRQGNPAFHPLAPQEILELDQRVFGLLRTPRDQAEKVLCLINISDITLSLDLNPALLPSSKWVDLLTKKTFSPGALEIEPYQVLWLV
jgi:sucrose phosphorylase